jgi:glycosyltransferase involved in cell wall biosynthesis
VFQNKRIHLAKCRLYPVAISNWLKECAQDSAILRQRDVALIHNGIDANKYKPIPKHKARQAIGLPLDARIILFGAIGVDSPYKGFDLLCQARAKIDADVFFVTFGNLGTSVLEDLHAPYRHMGYVRDIGQLSEIYSAADLFVAPSRMEAFGKTIVEALACGTPVVCFDSGGPRDIVIHQQVGFRAIPFQSESLAEGINWCLNEMAVNEVHLRAACRKHAETNFDINGKIVTQYIDLYAKLLEDRSNSCLEQA